jgi:hypothetical protein
MIQEEVRDGKTVVLGAKQLRYQWARGDGPGDRDTFSCHTPNGYHLMAGGGWTEWGGGCDIWYVVRRQGRTIGSGKGLSSLRLAMIAAELFESMTPEERQRWPRLCDLPTD